MTTISPHSIQGTICSANRVIKNGNLKTDEGITQLFTYSNVISKLALIISIIFAGKICFPKFKTQFTNNSHKYEIIAVI
jgi:hypothetical protein